MADKDGYTSGCIIKIDHGIGQWHSWSFKVGGNRIKRDRDRHGGLRIVADDARPAYQMTVSLLFPISAGDNRILGNVDFCIDTRSNCHGIDRCGIPI
ncbi:hypothetical protein WK04_11925 [Burkholderia ubonensis]|nr:hypothetical protein WK04_11925 [Burkholderia ubonensis]